MGLNVDGARFLLQARARGVLFTRVLTIGRQLLGLTPEDLRRLARLPLPPGITADLGRLTLDQNSYSEPFFRLCGAEVVDSMDNGVWEHATVLHDLNVPIPETLRDQYDVVFDGGSLEHVFNVPVALRNCMEMLKVGGHFVAVTPTNNYSGHGFYQFSPEFFFATFAPENGFELCDICLCEDDGRSAWYRLSLPSDPLRRLSFQNHVPAYLLVLARKTADAAVFATCPQQRMYTTAWGDAGEARRVNDKRLKQAAFRLINRLPARLFRLVLNTWNVRNRFRRDMFTRVE